MIKVLDSKVQKITTFNLAENKIPIVISIPHSGIYLSENMKSKLLDNVTFANIDWYLSHFYSFLNELGFTTIINNTSRYEIDCNRSIQDINQEKSYKNMIYTKTTFEDEIYKKEPTSLEIQNRINEFYLPYHDILNKEIEEKLKHFNKVYLLDLHSFGKNLKTDIILGNDNNKTTTNLFIENISLLLKDKGFTVQKNKPYSGGYIIKNYKNKFENCETLQIELSYQTYIENREFGNEEFPNIHSDIYQNAQNKMRNFFEEVNKLLKKLK